MFNKSVIQNFRSVVLELPALLLILGGCASQPAPSIPDGKSVSLEVFLLRASLFQTEYEQYKLTGTTLYSECGEVKRGRNDTKFQDITQIPSIVSDKLQQRSYQLLNIVQKEQPSFPPSGDASGLADPGIAAIKIKCSPDEINIKTSVDELSSPISPASRLSQELVSAMRKVSADSHESKAPCGNPQFYGIPMREP